MEIAYEVAQRLNNRKLDDYLGYFLLGSTSPDIRVITRRTREEYHFVTLDFSEVGEGVETMFGRHPNLRTPEALDYETQAFMAGYITHLIADETWIVTMFRRYFGNETEFGDRVVGNVMDRAIQLELDRRAWGVVVDVSAQLESAKRSIGVNFIQTDQLGDWRDWILGFIERGFSWERLRFMATRIAQGEEDHPAYEVAENFIQDVQTGLDNIFEIVPQRVVADYRERTVESLTRQVREYLG